MNNTQNQAASTTGNNKHKRISNYINNNLTHLQTYEAIYLPYLPHHPQQHQDLLWIQDGTYIFERCSLELAKLLLPLTRSSNKTSTCNNTSVWKCMRRTAFKGNNDSHECPLSKSLMEMQYIARNNKEAKLENYINHFHVPARILGQMHYNHKKFNNQRKGRKN